jgi:hypothetical protein
LPGLGRGIGVAAVRPYADDGEHPWKTDHCMAAVVLMVASNSGLSMVSAE